MGKALSTAHFDYSSVSAEAKSKLIALAGQIKRTDKAAIQAIIGAGESLSEAKKQFKADKVWRLWLELEVGISYKTADNYINAFLRFPSECEIISHSTPTAVYLLAAPEAPEQAAREAEKLAAKGQKITVAKAKEILAKLKEKAKASASDPRQQPRADVDDGPRFIPPVEEPEDSAVESQKAQPEEPAADERTRFDVAAIEAEQAKQKAKVPKKDGWGIPIQEHAAEAFEAVPLFDELLTILRKVKVQYADLAEKPGGAYLQRPGVSRNVGGRFRHDGLENLIAALEDSKPTYTVCPYEYHGEAIPESKHKHDKKCQLCHGLNWSRELGKQERSEKVIEFIKEKFDV